MFIVIKNQYVYMSLLPYLLRSDCVPLRVASVQVSGAFC